MNKLLGYLILKGGRIVSSIDCSNKQIEEAKSEGRIWFNDRGHGFVYLEA